MCAKCPSGHCPRVYERIPDFDILRVIAKDIVTGRADAALFVILKISHHVVDVLAVA
jgi:hypothetical protein